MKSRNCSAKPSILVRNTELQDLAFKAVFFPCTYILYMLHPFHKQFACTMLRTVEVCTGRDFRISPGPARGPFGSTQPEPEIYL
jgi:hypothetical protein